MPSPSLEVVFRRRGTPLGAAEELRPLAVEFPTVQIGPSRSPFGEEEIPFCTLEAVEWEHPTFGFYEFDARMNDLAERTDGHPFGLRLLGPAERLPSLAFEVLTRCQRLADRRNHESCGPEFDRVLRCHRELHNLAKPLVRADHSHTLDTWQWVLRLNRGAGLAVQLAALFHDIERLVSEADVRVEHQAPIYQSFKDDHARRGAAMAVEALAEAGIDEPACRRVARLIG
ncbi:MAG TPA: DUF4202 family protein, partial [Thermoanaerobaculia bacterium]|nr:DUF4202 family protein [Thermoanaerobaculia bacterium]